jgi:two-component system chemotaxis response regulator CheB
MRTRLPPAALIDLVAIGGSAGAIEVLCQLVLRLEAEIAPAIAIVIHMAQDARAVLPHILSAPGRPHMKSAEDKESILPGTMYFAPPGYHLLIERERTFALSVDAPVHFSRPSIDVLFDSAADAYGPRLAGVILSGANTDGAAGLRAIEAAGGVAIVQRPDSAISSTMPEAARAACSDSVVVDVRTLAEWLASLRVEDQ